MQAGAEHHDELNIGGEGVVFMVCNQNSDIRPIVQPRLAGLEPMPLQFDPLWATERRSVDLDRGCLLTTA